MFFPSPGSSLVKKWVKKYIFSVFTGYRNKSKVSENEKCYGSTSHRQVFPQLFRVLQNAFECFCNRIETERKYLLLPLENIARKRTPFYFELLLLFDRWKQRSLCYGNHFIVHRFRPSCCNWCIHMAAKTSFAWKQSNNCGQVHQRSKCFTTWSANARTMFIYGTQSQAFGRAATWTFCLPKFTRQRQKW